MVVVNAKPSWKRQLTRLDGDEGLFVGHVFGFLTYFVRGLENGTISGTQMLEDGRCELFRRHFERLESDCTDGSLGFGGARWDAKAKPRDRELLP